MEECCDIGEDGCEWAADYTGSRERMRLSCLVRCLRLPPNGMRATKEEAPPWRGMLLVCVVFLVIFVFVLRGGFADFFHDDGIGFVANGCRFQRVDFFQAQAVHPVVAEVETVVDEVFFLQLRVVEGEGRGVVGDIAFIHHHAGLFHAVRVKNPLFAIVYGVVAFCFFAGEDELVEVRVVAVKGGEDEVVQVFEGGIAGDVEDAVQFIGWHSVVFDE